MNQIEAAQATTIIGMMLKAFPSSQSTMTDDSAMAYLFAVEDYSLAAVTRACRDFIKGKVPDRNKDFAPSAPALAERCEIAEGALKVEAYEAARIFIEADSELWRKMEIVKGNHSLVSCTRHGKRGWFFLPEEVAKAEQVALPPPVSEAERLASMARLSVILGNFTETTEVNIEPRAGARVCACEGDCQCEPEETE
ncbi:hypothetical protein [Devosia sp.]|uniref:hypothetical protein n=1 Tax=Devosia sp. TaxID=1871048 RepID=UPI001B1A65C7|nr:hypothetical protein [Devosia sp.]MBO9589083.1 hypothetical protein [Devosia sp.]